ncbi:hypothetical protein JX265_000395 [Neoarthrinium moseri]|uniref:Ricin B lectin domain-containing protein n=1 Tax=Neoarthrinium moseri TaxID=1658444 RepID=A0A9P9WYG5_9PEZI|nr:uncharacterized protein JN550_000645 [Neoarthrinium moseri]KAI1878463.1 hypothetical protein JN550_000645 [Neoarthrinium moseri]KAI1881569.1 hypothetical protein JX265_000395 [Neoarthrinium moseri]
MVKSAVVFAAFSTLASAGPVYRLVGELDQGAFEQAQQRDDTAVRTLSNTNIQTSDGRCLFVDELSGDSSANLTPIQVAACGATAGQGWDVITQGKHNDVAGSILIASTLTQACLTFDPTQATGSQVMLFSCGGVADGSGSVSQSQLFASDGSASSLSLTPANQAGSCFTVKGNVVEIADCQTGNAAQTFTFDGVASESDGKNDSPAASTTAASPASKTQATGSAAATNPAATKQLITVTCEPITVTERITETVTASGSAKENAPVSTSSTTTVFVTVAPSSAPKVPSTSSTTTVYVTVTPSSAADPATSAAATTAVPSSKAGGNTATIPQISISPSTTVVL